MPGLDTRRVVALAALAMMAFGSNVAEANGRFPAASMLVARPGDPSHLVLRATYGLLFSRDGGGTWDWLCERAVGYQGNEDPAIAVTGSGAVIAGLLHGASRSSDDGCSWRLDSSGPPSVLDMAIRSSASERVYAVSSVFTRQGDGGAPLYASALFVSDDAGVHWSRRAEFDASLVLDSVEVAPNDPQRVYVSATRRQGKETHGVLLVSSDDGVHLGERSIPLSASDRGVYIAGVDPNRADRVYLRTSGPEASRILVTEDAGKTSRVILEGAELLGFALAEDGTTLYAGGPADGIFAASAADLIFTKRSSQPVQCLTMVGSTLWACMLATRGFVLGASTDGGVTFAPKLTLAGMRGPLRCATPSALAACEADWAVLRQLVGIGEPGDAGAAKARPATHACGCTVPGRSGSRGDGGAAWLFGGVVLAGVVRAASRRDRRAHGPRTH